MQLFMMEKPCPKEKILKLPSSMQTCNGDDKYDLEINEDEMQQLLQSIDDIMGPGNTHIEMDVSNNQSNTQQDLSNTTTAFLEGFDEFEKTNLPACGSGDTSIDASILQEFDIFEKTMLPPSNHGNMDSMDNDVLVSINSGEEDVMELVNEMADDRDETINFVEEKDLRTLDFDDKYDFGGGGGMDPFSEPQVHYIKCSGDTTRRPENGSRRKKEKRKYRGVIETEEQTAKRLAIIKIKNREAAIRAYERRKEHDAFLEAQLKKLRRKNRYLKNLIKYLECQNTEHMQLQPLRRTRSGLM